MIEVFFNRPERALNIGELIEDIEEARQRIVLASAWFTDTAIAQAIIDSSAPCKLAFLNKTDLNRGETRAVKRLYEGLRAHQIFVLGGDSFEQGIMHHKWCLIDADLIWLGSYNFTMQARRNYETLIRIRDGEAAAHFWKEAEYLMGDAGRAMGALVGAPDVCIRCGQLVALECQQHVYDGVLCEPCYDLFYQEN
jgi:phosphatidylserine/phosphatidylglycerophosphate/cardiolipin synthase-like enzyme